MSALVLPRSQRKRCRRIGRLSAGDHFGERACWAGENQAASVVALTVCELYRLSCENLHNMVKSWPELRTELGLKGAPAA